MHMLRFEHYTLSLVYANYTDHHDNWLVAAAAVDRIFSER